MTARAFAKIAVGLDEAVAVARGTAAPASMRPPDLTPAALRAWRDARGWTRIQAAQAFGVPAATLAGLEAGRRPESPLFGPLTRLIALLDERDAR